MGGTFTKSVAVDRRLRFQGKGVATTTYPSPARGIHRSLKKLTRHISLPQIQLVAFSTTHTVNALLEGDVRPVGILAMSSPQDKKDTQKRTRLTHLRIGQQKKIKIGYRFLSTHRLEKENIKQAINELVKEGAEAIVATQAFGVDEPVNENRVIDEAHKRGIPAVGGHQISQAYGLEIRTITAVINAAILPHTTQIAEQIERVVKELKIEAPIRVMKGEGGLADLTILKKKPVVTLFSGPAATVVGATLLEEIIEGIVIEVGGTSTNLAAIKNGEPTRQYVEIFGWPTVMRSIDVRIAPVGGGGLIQVKRGLFKNKVGEVGPRSARKAGLPYAVYAGVSENVRAIQESPLPGDPANYLLLEDSGGQKLAPTLSCAANCQGFLQEGDYARGDVDSARRAMEAVAQAVGRNLDPKRVAKQVLEKAVEKLKPKVEELIDEYRLRTDRLVIYGGGGGGSVIVPYLAQKLGYEYKLLPQADAISALGAASLIQHEEIERPLGSKFGEQLRELIRRVKKRMVKGGAHPGLVTVTCEYIPARKTIRVAGWGVPDTQFVNRKDARKKAATILEGEPSFEERMGTFYIFKRENAGLLSWNKKRWAVIDQLGRVRLLMRGEGFKINQPEEINSHLPAKPVGIHLLTEDGHLNLSQLRDRKRIISVGRKFLKEDSELLVFLED